MRFKRFLIITCALLCIAAFIYVNNGLQRSSAKDRDIFFEKAISYMNSLREAETKSNTASTTGSSGNSSGNGGKDKDKDKDAELSKRRSPTPTPNKKPKEEVINVLTAGDEMQLVGIPALINSIMRSTNASARIAFHSVVESPLSALRLRRWLQSPGMPKTASQQTKIALLPAAWLQNKIRVRGGRSELSSVTNFARFYYLKLFPEMQGRILFMDCDVVVPGDIQELHSTPLKAHEIGSFISDCSQNLYKSFINFTHPAVMSLNMSPEECCLNAGVFVADIQKWKTERITEISEYWLSLNVREPVFKKGGSQPPMLIAFYKKRAELDPKWHVRHLGWKNRFMENKTEAFINQSKLLHWNGAEKPWLAQTHPYFRKKWGQFCVPEPAFSPTALKDNAATLSEKHPSSKVSKSVYETHQVLNDNHLDPGDLAYLIDIQRNQTSKGYSLDCKLFT